MDGVGFVNGAGFMTDGASSERRRVAVNAKERDLKKVKSVEDYLKVTRKDTFSVMMFVAPNCKACDSMTHHLQALAEQHPDKEFYEMNIHENKPLAKSLGVESIPSFHFYTLQDNAPGTLENFATSSARNLESKLAEYKHGKFDVQHYRFA
uniref:Thioredoxin domain-containing protein n=1 Tax=Rhodosorus marinus TaxID=101924 RepID=A0A7S3A7M3_9RHOD|mmetsp:Transcript_6348/g.27040  ORF Transcript_6348/g.27040 Transcript_6348/m.27040 type:complete len:151 (+) Transcript_6348:196-648(+)